MEFLTPSEALLPMGHNISLTMFLLVSLIDWQNTTTPKLSYHHLGAKVLAIYR